LTPEIGGRGIQSDIVKKRSTLTPSYYLLVKEEQFIFIHSEFKKKLNVISTSKPLCFF